MLYALASQIVVARVVRVAQIPFLAMLVSWTTAMQAIGAELVDPVSLEQFQEVYDDTSWVPADGRMTRYLRPAEDLGWKARMKAMASFTRQGQDEVTRLLQAVKGESVTSRALAAQALGYLGESRAQSELAKVVEGDADPLVRLYAADSLGMLGGREHETLLKRLIDTETNSDVKRHRQYAIDRQGTPVDVAEISRLKDCEA